MQSFTKQMFITLSKVTFLFLVFFSFQMQAQVTISGTVERENGDPLIGLSVYATDLGLVQTDINGTYTFTAPSGYSGTVFPISPFDWPNGLTYSDTALIRQHILALDFFDTPYQILAADANESGGVSTLDMVQIAMVVDGTISSIMNAPSWEFIPADFEFPFPNFPVGANFDQLITFTNLTTDEILDFIAVKNGDPDLSADTDIGAAGGAYGILEGHIYLDENGNCTNDDEPAVDNWTFELSGGTQNFYQIVDDNGHFIIFAEAGTYNLEAIPPSVYWGTCGATMPVTIVAGEQTNVDFGATALINCPLMEVNLSTPFLRRCFDSNYNIEYCNTGTELAEDATVTVIFDDFFDVVSTSETPTSIDGNVYTFDLGDVEVGECGSISAMVYVSCDAELGQTHCTEALITPDDWCFPTNALYSGADLEVTGTCENEEVKFRIENVGDDMTEPVDYIIIEDLLVKNSAELQLDAGDFIEMSEASNGTTCRLEVEQIANHPLGHQLIAFVEGCGTHSDGSISLGFVTMFPFDGDKPFTDIDCRENIGAYDPNDITGFPHGYDTEHFIDKGQKLEYLIRFQNTGTDTAFNIRVENPLPAELDWSTFRPLVSSHDYDYVFEEDQVVFYFQDIMLADSNINEAASHGYIRYEIEQKADLEIGTVINNSAGIFFDFNEPVLTNTYFHTIGEPIFTVESSEVFLPNVAINYFPNPVADNLTVELETEDFKNGKLEIFDAQGRLVKINDFESNSLTINVQDLTDGLYFFYVSMNGNAAASGKLVKK